MKFASLKVRIIVKPGPVLLQMT